MSVVDKATTSRLDRYVSRLVLDWVTDEPDRRWRLVEGTMVFADISGFTALSERLATLGRIGTEELVDTLSRVFGGMLGIAAGHGGQLLKFGGDALLLLFTGPDHARHAASAAVEMRADLRRATQIPTSVGKLKLSISMGAHSGAFHLFLVGDPYPQLVVLGPDTTAAMDAESAAVAGQIVVTATMAELLGPNSTTPRDDGELLVRWRKAAVPPFEPPPARETDAAAARRVMPPIMASVLDIASPDPMHRIATMAFFKFKGTDQRLAADGPDVLADALHEMLVVAEAAFDAEDIALLSVDVDANGGKLVCSSGVPLTSEDDEGRMLRAARALVNADTAIKLQVGVNRGHVFAGEVGSNVHGIFSVMGDTVNTAARIMVTASPGVIHVHPAVLEHARTRYEATQEGPFTFKGKALPQVVYRVGDELGPRETTERQELPFLGRNEELAVIRQSVGELLESRGGVVTLTGAAGLGKSRLIREALADVAQVTTLAMHAEPYGATNSYRVLRDPLRALFGVGQGDAAQMADRLRETVRRAAPHLEPFLPLLGDVLQFDVAPTPEVESISSQFRSQRTADIVVALIGAVHDGELIVHAEDMQWADDASAVLLGHLANSTHERPWLLIVSRRDDEGGFVADVGTVVTIGALPDDIIRRLAIEATEAAPLRPHEIDLVVERAAGSPLFVGELIAAVQELGSLEAVPASLQGTLAAQVDALDPLSKRVLSYASVLGRSFRRSVVDELLRHEGLELDSATSAQLSRFIEADGPLRFRFKNGLVCDVVYDGLAYRVRARLHRLAGEAFEHLSTDLAVDAAMLSLHYSNAGDHERTYRFASLAAARAEGAYAFAEAAVHYERAVDAARRVRDVSADEMRRLWVALGDARLQAGMLDAALDAYARAVALAGDDVCARAEIHLRRARARERAGAFQQALRETSRGRRLVAAVPGRAGAAIEARALSFAAVVRQRQERVEQARRAGLAAAEVAERHNDSSALAQAYKVISWTAMVLGRDDAESTARTALALYESLGDLSGQADLANNLGGYLYFEGRWDETLEYYRQSVETCRRVGNLVDAAHSEANIGEVLVSQGRLDEAEAVLRDAARVLRSSGNRWMAVFAEMHIGRLLSARGDVEEAEAMLRSVYELLRGLGSSATAYEASLYLADCLTRSGRPTEALELIAESSNAVSEDVTMFEATRALVSARALTELGFVNEAVGTIVEGVGFARERRLNFDLAQLLLLAAQIGPPFDAGLETDEPAEEASRLLDRLGVVTTVSS
jgi:class 3 adenylate cyclase/tetratricopeptide (TPR) repeat protein